MTSSLIDGYVLHQVLDTSAGCQEFSGMRQGICTMAQACSNMCSTTHLHLEEFASMSQTSISVTFWPSIQRQQSACKMFHVPSLWWLYTALLPELTRISIAIPPHSGKPSEVLFLPRWSDRNESRKTPKDTVNRSIVLSDVEPGDAYHWHSLA